MPLTTAQLETYERDGFVLVPNCFSEAEVGVMKAQLPAVFAEALPSRVVEKEGGAVRSVYGSHTKNEVFRRLSRHPRIVRPAMQILDGEVYVYQFKVNAKAAFDGDVWDWHQDYVFWLEEDGMPTARVANVLIFLDEVNEFNGPLFLIPGSHKEGVISVAARDAFDGANRPATYANSPRWISNLTASLKYSLDRETVTRLVKQYGIVAPKGPAGSAIFFHGNLVHASPHNISPFDRAVVIVSFNSTKNVPAGKPDMRPDFLVSRDCEPIIPLSDEALVL
jgi:ectoine hydroxylase